MAKPTRTTRSAGTVRQSTTLHTPEHAAELLECSENHVRRLIASGALPAVDIAQPGSRRPKTRIRDADLAAYIDASTRTAARA
jgi:excisionase family DNA binding protein